MEFVSLSPETLGTEHICCAISDAKCQAGYQAKKDWLRAEIPQGYTFRKLDVRGKVFIEYVPIERSWLPLEGRNFMVINCFWVSGQFKGQGYGRQLLDACRLDAQRLGLDGIVAISSEKKRPFMSDPQFFKAQGFQIVDEAPPFFKLWGWRSRPDAAFPRILDSARSGRCPEEEGIAVYYSDTCPFNAYYIGERLRGYAQERDVPLHLRPIRSQAEDRQSPVPWIICSVFYQGELVTLEMKPDTYLDPLISRRR